jgi:hypothetical protein
LIPAANILIWNAIERDFAPSCRIFCWNWLLREMGFGFSDVENRLAFRRYGVYVRLWCEAAQKSGKLGKTPE